MEMLFPAEETIRKRTSVRTYAEKPLTPQQKGLLQTYLATISNPFGVEVHLHLLGKETTPTKKRGTYGVIKGAADYMGASVCPCDFGLEALGYSFEILVLCAVSLGLGTCWLGGTFNRGAFSRAMSIREGDIFPIISPVGTPLEQKRAADTLMRFIAKSAVRKPWSDLFFDGGFQTPLTETNAGPYAVPLELVRLGPSASNRQPWRVVRTPKAFHFYKAQSPGYAKGLGFDIQKIDLGIAACHFHLSALENNLAGRFIVRQPDIAHPKNTFYAFSWILG